MQQQSIHHILFSFFLHSKYSTGVTIGSTKWELTLKSKELKELIDALEKKSAENQLSLYELKTVYKRIKVEKPTASQVLEILELCSRGRNELSVEETVKCIWRELRSSDPMNPSDFNTDHYNCILKFASVRQSVGFTQEVFNEMLADGNQPNA